jgi:transcriptional regulator with XRE-family HTH domain
VLLELRLEEGLDQAGVADLIGVTQQTVARYEAGRAMPRAQTLERLARVYETTVDGLLRVRASLSVEELRRVARGRAGRAARITRAPGRRRKADIEELRELVPDLAERLRHARLAAGFTQAQVAAHAGLSQALYSRYETGSSVPPLDHLAAIQGVHALLFDEKRAPAV